MAANQWFRLYSEFATDPKVQMMSEAMQRRLVMLFCMRCCDVTVTLRDEEIAFQLRISDAELAETKSLFLQKGFIDDDWNLVNWDKRQFSSDSSTARTRAYRERLKESKENSVTSQKRHSDALDTDTDTDTDSKPPSSLREDPPQKKPVKKSTQIPDDFSPNETGLAYAGKRKIDTSTELQSFINWHKAKGSLMKDWQAAWRTWCDKAVEFGRARDSPQRQTASERRAQVIAELTGRNHGYRNKSTERDITAESQRIA